ncbi:MAG: hypothetical protein ABFD97_07370 [Syntrophobacter sp.]
MRDFEGLASATLIASMPHKDRAKAIELVMRSTPRIPVWPQLTSYPAEQMMAQYIEGLPGLVEEEGRTLVRADTPEFDEATYSFYEEYLAVEDGSLGVENSRFAMGPETGASLRQFLETLEGSSAPPRAVKGQVIGPFTLLSGLKDQDGRALLFDERFQDIVPKLLAYKSKWQIEMLKRFGVPVIIFLDEPGLAGFGSSAFITISAELIQQLLAEVVEVIHSAEGLAGIHVCANTDWQLAFKSGFDIINFDAHTYFDKFMIYREECLDFLARGGNLAWGIVPTLDQDALAVETVESLALTWSAQVAELASGDMPAGKIVSQSLLTPSCGCGSLPEASAEKVLDLLSGLAERFEAK